MAPRAEQPKSIVAVAAVLMATVHRAMATTTTTTAVATTTTTTAAAATTTAPTTSAGTVTTTAPPVPCTWPNCWADQAGCATAGAGCGVAFNGQNYPSGRGICTSQATGLVCYDVCNPNHNPAAYTVSTGTTPNDNLMNQGVAEEVQMVRSGRNPMVTCPVGVFPTGQCLYAMQRCRPGNTDEEDEDDDEARDDQGLCVVVQNGGYECWNMCDDDHDVDDYCHMGSQACKDTVQNERDKCNAWSGWVIVVSILACCCCVGCGLASAGGIYAQRNKMGKNKDLVDDLPPPLEEPTYDQDFQNYDQEGVSQDVFDAIDRNHDGILSQEELQAAANTPAPPVAMAPPPIYPMGSFPTPQSASMNFGYPGFGQPAGMPLMAGMQPSFSTNPAQRYYTSFPPVR